MNARFIGITVFVAGTLLTAGSVTFVRDILEGEALSLAVPLWRGEQSMIAVVETIPLLFKTKRALYTENKALEKELHRVYLASLQYETLLRENEELKTLLGRSPDHTNPILASVLSRPNRSPYDTFILDAGRADGVSLGDRVFASDSVVLGTIFHLYEHEAKALLFSSPGEETAVVVGPGHVSVLAYGRGGGNFKMRLPRGIDIKSGDSIFLPTLAGEIVGVVEGIDDESSNVFRDIFFKTPVNIAELRFVKVLRASSLTQ